MSRKFRTAELVRRTSQSLGALYRAEAKEGALELSQFAVMEMLLKHGPQTEVALSRLTRIDRSTLNLMTKRLKATGLLASVAVESAKPGRNPMALSLTPKGISAYRKSERAVWLAEADLLHGLTPQQKAAFLDAMEITAFTVPAP